MHRKKIQAAIAELLLSQKLAVLATVDPNGSSYASLIAFAASADLQRIVFATSRATRKFANLRHNPKISLLVDNRSNREDDFHEAKAVTVIGVAEIIEPPASQGNATALYLAKHPYLEDFLASPSTAFILVSVWRYYLVSRFQEVMELHIKNENNPPVI
jgi:nitroimidazol reductase NimA-like FMN-containing flavoprotein (pyridoxamine 5'-phosphate oxidase superfamily)